jgi:autotransporter-associated beta strand protein
MLTNNGGILNVGATALYLGFWDPCNADLTLNSGQINLLNNAEIRFGENSNNSGISAFNQNGGTVTFYSDGGTNVGGTGSLNIGNAGAGTYTYNLNGGTLTVPQIRKAGAGGSGTFNFNGGTLKAAASSTTFMDGLTAAYVMAPGASIDTTNNDITITQALFDGDGLGGGLTKNGIGTLNLDGANSYTGPTIVTVGTLGGNGTIAGAVTVNSGASLAPGASIGTLTVNGNLTLNAGSTNVFEVDGTTPANDVVIAGAGVTYGGVLRVVPSGTLTVGQQFTLFSGAGAVNPGNFASVQSSNPGLVFGFTNGVLTVVSTMATNPTNITYSVSGSTLTLSWPADHTGWILQAQTNGLNAGLDPAGAWFDVGGSGSSNTNVTTINPTNPTVFYRLRQP